MPTRTRIAAGAPVAPGRKGTSSILVAPTAIQRTSMVLHRAKIAYRYEPIPTAAEILASRDERSFEELTRDNPDGSTGFDPATLPLAERLAQGENVARTIARLLTRSQHVGPTEPREIRAFSPPTERGQQVRPLPEAREFYGPRLQEQRLRALSYLVGLGARRRCAATFAHGLPARWHSRQRGRQHSGGPLVFNGGDRQHRRGRLRRGGPAPDERNPRVTITRETPARVAPPPPAANAPHKPLPKPASPPRPPSRSRALEKSPRRPWPRFAKGSKGRSPKPRAIPARPPSDLLESAPKGALTLPPLADRDFFPRKGPAPHGTAARSFSGPGPKPRAEFTPRPGAGKGAARPHAPRTAPNHTPRTAPNHTPRTAPTHERPPSPPKGQRRYVDSTSRDKPKGPSGRAGMPPDQRRMNRARGTERLTIQSQNPKGFPVIAPARLG